MFRDHESDAFRDIVRPRVRHLTSDAISDQVALFVTSGATITEACARSIAAHWQSPAEEGYVRFAQGDPLTESVALALIGEVNADIACCQATTLNYPAGVGEPLPDLYALLDYVVTHAVADDA